MSQIKKGQIIQDIGCFVPVLQFETFSYFQLQYSFLYRTALKNIPVFRYPISLKCHHNWTMPEMFEILAITDIL